MCGNCKFCVLPWLLSRIQLQFIFSLSKYKYILNLLLFSYCSLTSLQGEKKPTILWKFYSKQALYHLLQVMVELLQSRSRSNLVRNRALALWHQLYCWVTDSLLFFLYDSCLYSIIRYNVPACSLFQNPVLCYFFNAFVFCLFIGL